jgi:predicted TIM-barrel fold metal-dependent hydrolase
MKIFDIHPHIVTTDTDRYPRDPLGGNQSTWSQERPATTEQMLAAMDEAGIAKAALVQASTCYGFDNSYVADAVAQHPDRFTGVFSVDMLADDAAQKIRHWVSRKLTGLRLFTAGSTMPGQATWLDDPRTFAGWDAAADLGIPVCIQMRVAGLPQLQVLLDRYTDVPIVIDHFLSAPLESGPPYPDAEVLLGLARHRNVFLKLTPVVVNNARKGKATPESYLPRVIAEFGASRIAWGSNFPTTAPSLKGLLQTTLDAMTWASPDDMDWIFHKTAQRLYPALQD